MGIFGLFRKEYGNNGRLGIAILCRRVVNRLYNVCFLNKHHIYADYSNIFRNINYMQIGRLSAERNCRVETILEFNGRKFSPLLKIGNDVRLADRVHIGCAKYIEIGDHCLFGSGIYISDHYHGWYRGDKQSDVNEIVAKRDLGCEEVILGKNVWVGENVSILPGSHIGDNAIIGANSVVIGNIPQNAIAVGSPAKVVKVWKDGKWKKV